MTRALVAALFGFALAAAIGGCASEKPRVIVKTATGYSGQSSTVSVLGVYAAGRMNPEHWLEMAPAVATIFGPGCEPGFNDGLQQTKPRWFSMIDQQTRDEGVTEDMLRQIAPAARGGTIGLIETEWVEPPEPTPDSPASPVAQPARGRGRGGGRGRSSGSSEARPKARAESLFAVEALAFSVEKRAFVAEVRATGTYKDKKQTLKLFVDQLRKTFTGSSCTGWQWEKQGP
jgi:hypothetical protein